MTVTRTAGPPKWLRRHGYDVGSPSSSAEVRDEMPRVRSADLSGAVRTALCFLFWRCLCRNRRLRGYSRSGSAVGYNSSMSMTRLVFATDVLTTYSPEVVVGDLPSRNRNAAIKLALSFLRPPR